MDEKYTIRPSTHTSIRNVLMQALENKNGSYTIIFFTFRLSIKLYQVQTFF